MSFTTTNRTATGNSRQTRPMDRVTLPSGLELSSTGTGTVIGYASISKDAGGNPQVEIENVDHPQVVSVIRAFFKGQEILRKNKVTRRGELGKTPLQFSMGFEMRLARAGGGGAVIFSLRPTKTGVKYDLPPVEIVETANDELAALGIESARTTTNFMLTGELAAELVEHLELMTANRKTRYGATPAPAPAPWGADAPDLV